jgi:hypothetical protein
VARSCGKGGHTVRKIVQWEKSWIKDRTIPESKAGKHKHNISWMDDEGLLSAVQEFIKSQGESQLESPYYPLNVKLKMKNRHQFSQTCPVC